MTSDFLDNDFYNFTMSQFIWKHYRNVEVVYHFTNRSQSKLLGTVSLENIHNAIKAVSDRKPTFEDTLYLDSLNMFDPDYLFDLQTKYISPEVELNQFNDEYTIVYRGPWWKATFLETPILAALSHEAFLADCANTPGKYSITNDEQVRRAVLRDASICINSKIQLLRQFPYLNFVEFGSRRRASRIWQHDTLEKLITYRPWQVKGTSNVSLAQEFDLKPIGTMAHQLFMVIAALENPLTAQNKIMNDWYNMYGRFPRQLTSLTDTYGTDFFLDHLTPEQLFNWKAFRQDSGNPYFIGEKIVQKLINCGIDPRDKILMFTDGLDIQKMADIWGQFGTRIDVSFGWGTNLTNDMGFKPRSMVIKPVAANTRPCVKLSDNLEKAMGDRLQVEHYKSIVGYTNDRSEKVVY